MTRWLAMAALIVGACHDDAPPAPAPQPVVTVVAVDARLHAKRGVWPPDVAVPRHGVYVAVYGLTANGGRSEEMTLDADARTLTFHTMVDATMRRQQLDQATTDRLWALAKTAMDEPAPKGEEVSDYRGDLAIGDGEDGFYATAQGPWLPSAAGTLVAELQRRIR